MENIVWISFFFNVVYLLSWFLINKVRTSKAKIVLDFDNGNEFYESLDKLDQDKYWKEDTRNLNVFMAVLLLFLEITLYLLYKRSDMWLLSLVIGLIVSISMGILLSVKLQKKYRK